MAIITTSDITLENRRKTLREMAHISVQSFPDTDLDRRITQADQIIRVKWPGNKIPDDDNNKSVFITLSNIEAAIRILTGLAKPTFLEMARQYTEQSKTILENIKDIPDSSPVIISRPSYTDDTRRGTFV